MMFEGLTKQPVSLVDLCVRTAIDNVRYIGYVGGVEFELLERILQHCTLEQLKHIEDSTNDTDLSPVTDQLWKRFYKKDFGEKNLNYAIGEMEWNKVTFKWRDLYEAKLISLEKREMKVADKLKNSYKNEDARKLSRQTKLCAKAPPSKKPFWGNSVSGYNVSNVRSNIMRKAKLDLLKSQEVKNLTAIKRKTIQKSFSISAPKRIDFSANAPSTSRSISCGERPAKRINSLLGTAPTASRSNNSLLGTAPSTSRSITCGKGNVPPKSINSLLGTAPTTSRSLPPKRSNSLLGTAPSTAKSIPCGERTLPPKRVNSLLGTAPSTSRSNPIGERNLPAKRTNSLLGTAPSTARSNPFGERDLPAKRSNGSLLGTAPSVSKKRSSC